MAQNLFIMELTLADSWMGQFDPTKTDPQGIKYNGQKVHCVFGFQIDTFYKMNVQENKFQTFSNGGFGVGTKNLCIISRKEVTEELMREYPRWVHGSFDEFMSGKVCVITEYFYHVVDFGESVVNATFDSNSGRGGDERYTGAVYRKMDGCPFKSIKTSFGTIVVIGKTPSNNLKVVLKK